MLSGNHMTAAGKYDSFYYMLEEFSQYWDRVDIICASAPGAKAQTLFGNIHLHPSSWPKIFQPLYILWKGLCLSRHRHYDLMTVHEYAPFLHGMGGYLLTRFRKIPFISEFHHIEGYPIAANWVEKLRLKLSQGYVGFIAKYALGIRVVNRFEVPEFLIRHGVPKQMIHHVDSFHIRLTDFCPADGIKKKYDVVYCGRLVANKGLHILVEAIEILKTKSPSISLLLIGEGPLRAELEAQIAKLNLAENITFWGWADNTAEIASLYRQSRVFALPSFAEGGPKTPIEAMATGIPVVVTSVGLMKEIIRDGENGFIVGWSANDFASRIDELLSDPALYERLSRAGHETAQAYGIVPIVRNYALKYQKLVQPV